MTVGGALVAIDRIVRQVLLALCSLMLALMVGFTCYTVLMRTVFLDPPFWGDTMTLFANIWLVMLAFALSVRDRASIAMQMSYQYLPRRLVVALELTWTALFAAAGVLIAVYGYEVATRIPGAYWELGNLPKSVPMMILPVSGTLVALAALFVLVEDLRALRGSRFHSAGRPTGSG